MVFYTSPKGTSPKVNVKTPLEFKLVYYDVTIKPVSHYAIMTKPWGLREKYEDKDKSICRVRIQYVCVPIWFDFLSLFNGIQFS